MSLNPWEWVRDFENPVDVRRARVVKTMVVAIGPRHVQVGLSQLYNRALPKDCEVINIYDFSNFPTTRFWWFFV